MVNRRMSIYKQNEYSGAMIESKKKLKLNKQGFTLLEFLLVIALFGLVLAVVLPRALRAQSEGQVQYGPPVWLGDCELHDPVGPEPS